MDGNSLVGKIFSDNDNVNWAKLETSWANILRNTKRNISRLLDRKEDLLRKDTRDITSNDEREYEKLDEQIL